MTSKDYPAQVAKIGARMAAGPKAALEVAVLIGFVSILLSPMPVLASTPEQEIATEKLLDSRCKEGGGPSGTAWASCDARDLAVKELEKEGWCRGRGDQWRKCRTSGQSTGDQGASPKVEHVLYFGWPAEVGTSFPLNDLRGKIQMLLFTAKACPLPVVNSEHMRKYLGATGNGCWYPTLGGGYTILLENGYAWNSPGLSTLPEGDVDLANGTLVVTKESALYRAK